MSIHPQILLAFAIILFFLVPSKSDEHRQLFQHKRGLQETSKSSPSSSSSSSSQKKSISQSSRKRKRRNRKRRRPRRRPRRRKRKKKRRRRARPKLLLPPTPSPTESPTQTPSASPSTKPTFDIELMNMGVSTRFDAIFEKSKRRWEDIILNDLPDIPAELEPFDWFDGEFDFSANVDVDDLLIGYQVGPIDGPGGYFGLAGPIYLDPIFDDESTLISERPISGIMIFDADDITNLSDADAEIVILHEMGHILGIGTITSIYCAPSCDETPGTISDFNYHCAKANEKYADIFPNKTLQLENDGTAENRCGHWEEDNFQCDTSSELMTSIFEQNKAQPLTAVTIGALEDMWIYEVDYGKADRFVCGDAGLANHGQLVVKSENLDDFILAIEHTEPIVLGKRKI